MVVGEDRRQRVHCGRDGPEPDVVRTRSLQGEGPAGREDQPRTPAGDVDRDSTRKRCKGREVTSQTRGAGVPESTRRPSTLHRPGRDPHVPAPVRVGEGNRFTYYLQSKGLKSFQSITTARYKGRLSPSFTVSSTPRPGASSLRRHETSRRRGGRSHWRFVRPGKCPVSWRRPGTVPHTGRLGTHVGEVRSAHCAPGARGRPAWVLLQLLAVQVLQVLRHRRQHPATDEVEERHQSQVEGGRPSVALCPPGPV